MEPDHPADPYDQLRYRGLIAWPERLRREAPLLERVLGTAPVTAVLDLGCGTGEHSRFLQALGYQVTGVDASEAQIVEAEACPPEDGGTLRFVQGGLESIETLVPAGFGGAICLGNTLPHLTELDALGHFFTGLASRLVAGAPVLLQLLNYDRILDRGERTFPVSLRPGEAEGEETVFLRLMTHQPGGMLNFTPATLRFRPGLEPPLELIAARNVMLRGWRRSELEGPLRDAGFEVREAFGSMTGDSWGGGTSDLVLWAVKR